MFAEYVRPPVTARVFHDDDGRVINYGERWDGDPPEDAYSVTQHPERFAPLHLVADALIAHLSASYDVRVDEHDDCGADFMRPPSDLVRAVRLTPARRDAAPLTFGYTPYPGIALHAGYLHDTYFPSCGCDACDDTWEEEAARLERHVFDVVSGGYQEKFVRGFTAHLRYSLGGPGRQRSGSSLVTRGRFRDSITQRLAAAREQGRPLPDLWAPWPRRPGE
ncbi:DUF6226 family protein [Hoyosella sp. YIM 151337]|uniref:DUF6226 family protein n=1 Tax=Hoyosella sp. YIM 151337 TaxID=2992742 RepID=UPI00223608C9|nr:DUF6226 family protein [Hoyosella sp. YIM 151337]MCW4356046.1 DUF6226 family protein [Hoyosella sp. YIM 151337]